MTKRKTRRKYHTLLLVFFINCSLFAQSNFTLSGYIKDGENGETLIGATLEVPALAKGTVSNEYGFYSITLPQGSHDVTISYLGYEALNKQISFEADQKLDFEISPVGAVLEEVIISAKKANENIEKVIMSEVKLPVSQIKKMPALMGEVDIIKAIQLLPGVQTVGEGSSGFYVRGGAVDQNLILLDEAPVYNASHLLGFFSVFNADAIKDVQLYKGGIPANYGGRLASVLDVRMIDGNKKKFSGSGGIGTISSRLTLEGPILNDKSSFMVSGRRTYADVFMKLAKDTLVRQSSLYFYDLNAKVNLYLGENDRLFLSGYFGKDNFAQAGEFGFNWGNTTGTARWNHLYSSKLFSNLTVYYSDYNYFLGETGGVEGFEWRSNLKDISAKLDYSYFPNPNNSIRFGLQSIRHNIQPGVAKGTGDDSIFNELALEESNSWEHAAYLSNEQKIGNKLSLLYGVRFSLFQNVGPFTVYDYDDNFDPIGEQVYEKGKRYKTYSTLEPRMGIKYTLNELNSVKLSYNRTAQYIQLASNSTSSSPLDIWFPSSPNVKPQISDQIAIGYFKNFPKKGIEASVELYYKKMKNAIDFKDHAQLLLNKYLEGDLRFGEGRAYGMEVLVKKELGKLTGWVGYTLARTERKIEGINNGNYYPTKYDKTHDISVVLSYDMNERVNFSTNWIYGTGAAVTFPTGRYEYFGTTVPVYSQRNGERMPAYHRMDLACTLKGKRKWFKGKVDHDMVFSIYNVYNRKNAYSINFEEDEANPNVNVAKKTYLFKIIPAATLNFKF